MICSRAVKSLAIVAYTNDVDAVKNTAIDNDWFTKDEILTLIYLQLNKSRKKRHLDKGVQCYLHQY